MTIQITVSAATTEEAIRLLQKLGGETPQVVSSVAELEQIATTAEAVPVAPIQTQTSAPKEVTTELLVSDAVRAYAAENNVDLDSLTGSGKNNRITKGDVTKAIVVPEIPPEPVTDPDLLDWDAEPVEEPEVITKDTVRASLVAFQTAVKDKKIEAGQPEEKAAKAAMTETRTLLAKLGGGASTLGALQPEGYAVLVAGLRKLQSEL